MAINNVRANEPPPMSPYIRELEKVIEQLQANVAAQQTQINALTNRR